MPLNAKIMDVPAYERHDIFAVPSHHPSAITLARHATAAQRPFKSMPAIAHACGVCGAPRLP